MDYTEFYYINTLGYYPHKTEKEKLITKATIDFLFDSGFTEAEIIKAIETSTPGDCLTPEVLPEWLWEGSLVERGVYYYHHILHIMPAMPKFNPITKRETRMKFYLEVRPRFTMNQLIDYFYNTLVVNKDLLDYKRHEGAFCHLLNKYSKLNFIRSLDFVLSLIDTAGTDKEQYLSITNVLDIVQYESIVYDNLRRMTAQAELQKTNRIIWRSSHLTEFSGGTVRE